MDTTRIAVVGAGVVGLATAMCIPHLVPRCSITVISDKSSPGTTSDVAAGMLIPHAYPGESRVLAPVGYERYYIKQCEWDSVELHVCVEV